MCCSAYLWGGLIKNKGGIGLFQISQKESKEVSNLFLKKDYSKYIFHERLFYALYQPSDNLAMWSPFLNSSKKGLSFPFSLGKNRIYLETQLKGEFIDLFWKLPGYSLFLQVE